MLLANAPFSSGDRALILSLISLIDINVSVSEASESRSIKLNCPALLGHLFAQWSVPPHLKQGALALGLGTRRNWPLGPALAARPQKLGFPPLFLLNLVLSRSIGTGTLFILLGALVELYDGGLLGRPWLYCGGRLLLALYARGR